MRTPDAAVAEWSVVPRQHLFAAQLHVRFAAQPQIRVAIHVHDLVAGSCVAAAVAASFEPQRRISEAKPESQKGRRWSVGLFLFRCLAVSRWAYPRE